MEKSFRRLKKRSVRKAYVEAELLNGVSHQIRVLRQQRKWTQAQLAKHLKTTQGVVSRLEDPAYGKFSINTLLSLSETFDVALLVRFMSFGEYMYQTWNTDPRRFEAVPFSEEAKGVGFFKESEGSSVYFSPPIRSVSPAGGLQQLVSGTTEGERTAMGTSPFFVVVNSKSAKNLIRVSGISSASDEVIVGD